MKDETIQVQRSEKDVEKIVKVETPLLVPQVSGTVGGTRAGLFRTPISGGVQSATSAHGLPPPALAVRNLMEQVRAILSQYTCGSLFGYLLVCRKWFLCFVIKARFAHLCTVMSRMHHHRAGYPFGSLVDFAPDSMGRK